MLVDENLVVRNFRTTAKDGKHYKVKYYNLEMIIAIGYRVRSNIGTNFRKWATNTLNEYIVKSFAINDDLLKRAGCGRYFKELLARIRDIRSSERVFKTVQNKMHWATHGYTVAEIKVERANAKRDFIGLTSFYPTKKDAEIANNIIFLYYAKGFCFNNLNSRFSYRNRDLFVYSQILP